MLFKKLYSYKHWSCGTKVKLDLLLLILNFSWHFSSKSVNVWSKKSRNYVDRLTRQTNRQTDGLSDRLNNIQIDGE